MTRRVWVMVGLGLLVLSGPIRTHAQETGQGSVRVEGTTVTPPLDPEKPTDEVDPGDKPATTGDLRIDYAPTFRFGAHKQTQTTGIYPVLAQQFTNGAIRGNFIQVTDQRDTALGWTLQVKQNRQFEQTDTHTTLRGAVLSLDKGWANSPGTGEKPTVTRETIALNSIGSTYDIARAVPGTGRGIWVIAFGASDTNPFGQQATIAPLLDSTGAEVRDPLYQKPAYTNTAIRLTVPTTQAIEAGQYQTELTWLIGQLP